MADLLTHALATLVVGRAARVEGVSLGWLMTGAFLPDFVSRAPTILLGKLVGPVLPAGDYSEIAFAFSSLHTPFGFGLVAAAVVLALPDVLLPPLSRAGAWRLLMGGALLHIALDLLQMQYSMPPILFHPITLWGLDIGFLGTEDSMLAWPVLIPAALFVEWRAAKQRRATPLSGPPSEPGAGDVQRLA